jgi:ATP-binding protein involved in chromosome partitioning
VELGMVRDICFAEEGKVVVALSLTTAACPLKDRIVEDTKKAVLQVDGVKEVTVELGEMTPAEKEALKKKLGSKKKGLDVSFAKEFIAVTSGKGGVGKSTVTVNLALALSRKGKKVGIMDCDVYGFSIPAMLNVTEEPKSLGEKKIRPPEKNGIKVMSMGFFVSSNQPVIWRAPLVGRILTQFFRDVQWGELDFMLLDLPPGTGDVALDLHQMLPESREIIVTTPQKVASEVAIRAGEMAKRTHHEIMGVVENMAYFNCPHCRGASYIFGRGGADNLAAHLGVKILGRVPLAPPADNTSLYRDSSLEGQAFAGIAEEILRLTRERSVCLTHE